MGEKIVEVRMFEFRYHCEEKQEDKVCDGQMMPTGEILAGNPPLMKHRCMKCRSLKFLPRAYPLPVGLPVHEPIPEKWIPYLDREQVNNPPPEPSKIITS